MFYLYCVVGYILGEDKFDLMTGRIRGYLGRSPNLEYPSKFGELTTSGEGEG